MWVTSVAEVHNPDKFPRVRARGRSSVDQLALVDRSRRGWKPRLIDRSVSRIVHTEVRGGPAVALSRIPRSWFSATRPKPPAVISPSTRLSPLHLPQEPPPSRWKSRILCYPLSPTAVLARVRRLERYLSFSMCDPRPAPPPAAHPPPPPTPLHFPQKLRNIDCNGWNDIELKCDQPRYMFTLSGVTMEYVTRAIQPCGSIICIRLFWEGSRFSPPGLKRISRLYLMKYIYIPLYIPFTAALVGYLLFSFPRKGIDVPIEISLSRY